MARKGITYEQVAAVADSLVGEGQQPTIQAIRERLGTGSPNTVHKHLTTWRESRPVATAMVVELPQALSAAISAEIERAAAQARAEIEGRLVQSQSEATELAAAGEALEVERDALIEQVAELTRDRDMLAGKAAEQAGEIEKQREQIKREQEAAESARVELATARIKIEQADSRLSELSNEVARLRSLLEKSDQARQEATQAAAVLQAKLDAATARHKELEARADRAEKAQEAANKERDQIRKEATVFQTDAAKLRGQVEAMQEQQASLMKALDAKKASAPATTETPAPSRKPSTRKAVSKGA